MKILNLTLGGDISNHLFIDIYKYEMAVPRDSQIDAIELDSECYNLFQTQFNQAISHLPLGLLKRFEPEISALLNIAVYVIPIYTSSSLVGHQMLGITFSRHAAKLPLKKWYLYGWILVGLNWLSYRWKTIASKMMREESFQVADLVVDKCQILSKSFSLLNSLIFLKQGKYPTLLHRALNLRTHLVDPDEPKSSDLSTLTRELLWHSFAETLMFALPLINVHRAKRWFSDIVQQKEPLDPECILNTRNSECAVCDEVPVIPQEAKCHHIFCYYCLEANLAADSDFLCPLCSSTVG